MAKPLTTGDWTVFLEELHGYFEACGEDVNEALAAHFGFDTAADWITVSLELFTEHLLQSSPANRPENHRD
ncbi:hypothetical protein [Streptomyces stelliscabiei]|uniref:hypothetical protein n=1 Tax=Streptomyces stelliscabiei TaxID=146820 RepID=UPI002FF11877